MRALSRLLLAVTAALAATSAQAQFHAHDGFFLHLDAGIGYMGQSMPSYTAGGDLKLSGAAGSFGVAVGGAVAENFIVAGHLYTSAVSDPSASMSGGGSVTLNDTTSSLLGIGPQVTYYFMPVNVFVSGTLAATRLNLKVQGQDGNSDWGVGLRFALGKEWWVSQDWGLGVAGQLSWASNGDGSGSSSSSSISSWGLGLAFSATYN